MRQENMNGSYGSGANLGPVSTMLPRSTCNTRENNCRLLNMEPIPPFTTNKATAANDRAGSVRSGMIT